MEAELDQKRRKFVDEYLIDGNGTRAAIAAGYSRRTADSQASQLLRHPKVVAYMREKRAEQDALYEHRVMGKYEVLARLTDIARGDMGDLLGTDAQGNITDDVENLSVKKAKELGKSHLVKKAKVTTTSFSREDGDVQTVTAEIEMYSAHEALRDLGKHHGLFTDKLDVTSGGEKLPIAIVKMNVDEL